MAERPPPTSETTLSARQVIDLLWLRCGPQDLPYSKPLVWALMWLSLGLEFLAHQLLDRENSGALPIFLGFVLGLGVPWVLLATFDKRARYVQTLTALLVTSLVLSLAFLPLALVLMPVTGAQAATPATGLHSLLALLMLALVVWKIWVTGNIWRHALNWPSAAGSVYLRRNSRRSPVVASQTRFWEVEAKTRRPSRVTARPCQELPPSGNLSSWWTFQVVESMTTRPRWSLT